MCFDLIILIREVIITGIYTCYQSYKYFKENTHNTENLNLKYFFSSSFRVVSLAELQHLTFSLIPQNDTTQVFG